jgi:hypothetical protein
MSLLFDSTALEPLNRVERKDVAKRIEPEIP